MSSTVAINVPREITHATRMTPEGLGRELAIYLFQQGKLSFGKAREMANMTVWAFQQLLGRRGIHIHDSTEKRSFSPPRRTLALAVSAGEERKDF